MRFIITALNHLEDCLRFLMRAVSRQWTRMREWQSQISWFAIHAHSIACYLKVIDHLGMGHWSQWASKMHQCLCLCCKVEDGWLGGSSTYNNAIFLKSGRNVKSPLCEREWEIVEIFSGPHPCINIRNKPIWIEVSRSGRCQRRLLARSD